MMHKTEMDLRDICEMKEKLTSWLKEEFANGRETVDTCEAGQVVDMIKDFAEAEKDCWKAQYYKLMVCTIQETGDMYGYNSNRYASGRYAPSGHGDYTMGYPENERMGNIKGLSDYDRTRMPGTVYAKNDSMGYPTVPTTPSTHRSQTGNVVTSRYGYPYDEWNEARRYYTETRSEDDKKKMEHKAVEHIGAAVESINHIWKEADPALKERLKKELHPLLENLKKEGA